MKKCCSLSVSGTQLQSSVERPCPRESVTFTCTMSSLGHDWQIPSLNISRGLLHRNKDMVFSDPPFQFTVTEVVPGTSITSTATINVTEDLNSTLVVCRDGLLVLPDQNSTINLRGELEIVCRDGFRIHPIQKSTMHKHR